MQTLEAIIAFALTLAALATVVTIIMEAGMRIARMRKKNLIEVMKLLNKELESGPFKLDPVQRWSFIESVISNPVNTATDSISDVLSKKLKGANAEEHLLNIRNSQSILEGDSKILNDQLDEILNRLGSDKGAGEKISIRVTRYLRQLFGDPVRSSVYDKVSLEHVLRRLTELDVVQKKLLEASDIIKVELNRLARKYEEYGSAASANFKRHAQALSMIVGITFAVLANVDGLRIFNAYLASPELANAMIAQQEQLNTDNSYISKQQEVFNKAKNDLALANKKVEDAKTALDQAIFDQNPKLKEMQNTLAETINSQTIAEEELNNLTNPDQVAELLQDAQLQYVNLSTLGVPMGWSLYPNCPYGDKTAWLKSDQKCQSIPKAEREPDNRILFWLGNDSIVARVLTTAHQDLFGFFQWLLLTIVTGLLIGLGAPFWFDVAKRMSQIRQGVRARASGEERMAANNADGDPDKRKKIIKNIVKDVVADALLMPPDNKQTDDGSEDKVASPST